MAVDALQLIKQALTDENDAISAAIERIARQPHIAPADMQSLVDMVHASTQRINEMVPDAPPAP
jgi:hypothetical protein